MTQPIPAPVLADAAAAARLYLRAESGAEPEVIGLAARAAFELAEAFCGQPLVARTAADPLPQSWADLPGALAQGVVQTIATLIDRGADVPAPPAATALWRPFRVARLLPLQQAQDAAGAAS